MKPILIFFMAVLFCKTVSYAQWAVNGTTVYYTSGNVGIGTSSPGHKLSVNGDINLSTGSVMRVNGITVLKDNGTNDNIGVGDNANGSLTSGSGNTAIGKNALYYDTSGSYNTANGERALYNNISGTKNTATGYEALIENNTGTDNTANGYDALYNNSWGYANTGMGMNALYHNYFGVQNVAIGKEALFNTNSDSWVVAIGYQAMYNDACGSEQLGNSGNVAVGYQAIFKEQGLISTGITAVGYKSLYSEVNGWQNTAIGYQSLYNNIAGRANTVVGYNADVNGGDYNDASAFGSNAIITGSNQVRIGDNSVTSIGGYKAWSNISDGRVKKNIKQNVPGLAFINLLQPITYNLDLDAADKIIQRPVIKNKSANAITGIPPQEDSTPRHAQEQVVCTGFSAQDVESSAKKIGYEFDGVDAAKNSKDLYGLRYSEFVVPLVKAVQELSVQNDSLKKDNVGLQNQVDELRSMMRELKSSIQKMQAKP